MRHSGIIFALLLLAAGLNCVAQEGMFESLRASKDMAPSADPTISFWQSAGRVYADRGRNGEAMARYRTEIRSRWTKQNLYFLFICPYEELNLNPSPSTTSETNRLWEWDVAEAFIGSDFQNIQRYKEFEVSPQGEWVDLDIDLTKPHHEDGWTWNSGFQLAARVDPVKKVWYGAMRIPFAALDIHRPAVGDTLRINLFWSQSRGAKIAWQPPMGHTFHIPERFGLLRLARRPK
jgi:hypothetical protein